MNTKLCRAYVIGGISIAILLVVVLLFTDYKDTMLLFIVNNLTLFLLCCFYFMKLFSSTEVIIPKNNASFWVVIGILICMCVSLPFAAYRFFLSSRLPKDYAIQQNIFFMATLGYIIMHLFFIKAYLGSIAQAKK